MPIWQKTLVCVNRCVVASVLPFFLPTCGGLEPCNTSLRRFLVTTTRPQQRERTNKTSQIQHRSSLKSPVIVDEDCGIPATVVDNYREHFDVGPLGPSDPQALLLSMSEYNKPQNYDVYGEFIPRAGARETLCASLPEPPSFAAPTEDAAKCALLM